jgi:glycosyltransferase involved in cell wall biosynthesis
MNSPLTVVNEKKQGFNIIWAEFIIWDLSLSKTTELEILNGLRKLNHNVELIALRSRNKSIEKTGIRLTLIPLRNVRLVTPILFTFVQALLLPLRIAFSKIDVIISEPGVNILGFFPALLIGKIRKTKFVLDIRSPPVDASSHFLWSLEKISFDVSILIAKKFFDGLTIITSQMGSEICEKYNVSKGLLGIWPSGVSISVFNPDKYFFEKNNLKKTLGLECKFVVFYHGFLSEDRGLKESVEAMSLLRHDYPDIVLFILGSGPFEQELKAMIVNQNLADCVMIHEPVDYLNVPKFIAMSDVGIVPLPDLPKWRTQCPLKLLEFMAMSKSVILTDIPAHRDIAGHEKYAFYVSAAISSELAKAIIYAYKDRENLPVWGKKGREIVSKRYTWDNVAKSFEDYLFKIQNTD